MAARNQPGCLEAAEAGHSLVHDHELRGEFIGGGERLLSGRCFANQFESFRRGHDFPQSRQKRLLVIDDQNRNGLVAATSPVDGIPRNSSGHFHSPLRFALVSKLQAARTIRGRAPRLVRVRWDGIGQVS